MTARGIANNNPMNIRNSRQLFQGEKVLSADKDFKQFQTAILGIRAGVKIIGNYYRLYGLSTVRQIISRWAPGSENDTASYITDVCKHMAIGADVKINVFEPSVMQSLVAAIIWHENGSQPYSNDDINQAIALAFPPASLPVS